MASLNHSFAGKRVLVTGGGRGIGYEIVKKFYNDGAVVFVLDKDQGLLNKVKAELPKVTTLCVDLLNWDETFKAVRAIAPLDHLVNNAGVFKDDTLLDVKPQDVDLVFSVNVKAMIVVSNAFVKGIIEEKGTGGTIVNMSSLGDRIAFWGGATYSASKAAITMLTQSMALEYAEYNVRVNCLNASFTGTEMVAGIAPHFMEKAVPIVQRGLIKDPLMPEDIATYALVLSSPFTSKTTGASHLVDVGVRCN